MVACPSEWEHVRRALGGEHAPRADGLSVAEIREHLVILETAQNIAVARAAGDENFEAQAEILMLAVHRLASFSFRMYGLLKQRPTWEALDADLARRFVL